MKNTQAQGYSLIELILIIAIISIGFAIASPRYANAQNNYKIKLAANQLIHSLQITMNHATSKKQAFQINVDTDTGLITFPGIPSPNQPTQDWSINLSNQYNVSVTQNPTNTNPIINGYGKPDQDYAWTLTLGTHSKVIKFNQQTGAITQSP